MHNDKQITCMCSKIEHHGL